jgi:hypothetical protein
MPCEFQKAAHTLKPPDSFPGTLSGIGGCSSFKGLRTMSMLENAKRTFEIVSGIGRPANGDLASLIHERKPNTFRFEDDGETPNNPRVALVLYRSPIRLRNRLDPAAIFEELFAASSWKDSWRNGMYDYLHFHTGAHEVLGIARGALTREVRRRERTEDRTSRRRCRDPAGRNGPQAIAPQQGSSASRGLPCP